MTSHMQHTAGRFCHCHLFCNSAVTALLPLSPTVTVTTGGGKVPLWPLVCIIFKPFLLCHQDLFSGAALLVMLQKVAARGVRDSGCN